jgi:hypothetical protein
MAASINRERRPILFHRTIAVHDNGATERSRAGLLAINAAMGLKTGRCRENAVTYPWPQAKFDQGVRSLVRTWGRSFARLDCG